VFDFLLKSQEIQKHKGDVIMKSKQSVILGLLLPTLPAAVEAQFEDHFMPIARTICRKVMATRYRAARAFGLLAILLSASPLTVEGWPNQYQFIYAIDNGASPLLAAVPPTMAMSPSPAHSMACP
jgi:hypothetical protein